MNNLIVLFIGCALFIGIILVFKNTECGPSYPNLLCYNDSNVDCGGSAFITLHPNESYSNSLNVKCDIFYISTLYPSLFSIYVIPFDFNLDVSSNGTLHRTCLIDESFPSCIHTALCMVSIKEFKRKHEPFILVVNNNAEDNLYVRIQSVAQLNEMTFC